MLQASTSILRASPRGQNPHDYATEWGNMSARDRRRAAKEMHRNMRGDPARDARDRLARRSRARSGSRSRSSSRSRSRSESRERGEGGGPPGYVEKLGRGERRRRMANYDRDRRRSRSHSVDRGGRYPRYDRTEPSWRAASPGGHRPAAFGTSAPRLGLPHLSNSRCVP